MTVTNLLQDDLSVVTSDAVRMSDTFPDQEVPAGKTSPYAHVSASILPGQSHFKLSYQTSTGEDLTVDIGSWPYVTDVTYGSDGAAGAVLAPMPGSGADYSFLFFAGASGAKRNADSFIQANLSAIVAWVAQNPIAIDLGGGATLTITGLDVTSDNVSCRFATFTPVSPPGTLWKLTTIMEITGSVSATISWKGISSDATVSVSQLAVLVEAGLDVPDEDHVKCALVALACSLGGFSISGGLIEVIKVLFPTLYLALVDSYTLAGAVNTTYNLTIMEAVNAALAAALESSALAGAVAGIGRAAARQDAARQDAGRRAATPRRPSHDGARTGDYSTWMSEPAIQAKSLSELTLPGTHDSATFALEPVLSQIKYDDIKFLWRLSPDPAPADGNWPFPEDGTIHVGSDLMSYVLNAVMRVSTAQINDLTQQLNDGIRFFDLRIYHDTDGHYYAQHAVRGLRFEDLLAQVRLFIDAHPTSGELIFLQISQTNFQKEQAAEVSKMIRDHLDPYLYMPTGAQGVKNFNFQILGDLYVAGITAGAPKVIVLDTDGDYVYAHTVVSTSGFATSNRKAGGTDSVIELATDEGNALDANTKALYEVSWTLTPQVADIAGNVLQELSGLQPEFLIAELALTANSVLAGFFSEHQGHRCNLVTLDWYDLSQGAAPVEVIINLNYLD